MSTPSAGMSSASLGVHNVRMDLATNPQTTKTALPYDGISDCQTIGDLHGNALKLLNFLILRGAARFKNPADYAAFQAMCEKPVENWKNFAEAKTEMERLLVGLEISSKANIRLLGDDLADRGYNDYFTLALIANVKKKGGKVKVIMSNHTAEFVRIQERDKKYDAHQLQGVVNGRPYNQAPSATNLYKLIHQGTPADQEKAQEEVDQLYANYAEDVEIVSYDLGPDDALQLHSHAPISEIDILRMALCLLPENLDYSEMQALSEDVPADKDPASNWKKGDATKLKNCVTDDDKTLIRRAISHARGEGGQRLNNHDVMDMIDMLNRVAQKAAVQGKFSLLNELRLTKNALYGGMNFGKGYGGKAAESMDDPKVATHPYHCACWNREDPDKNSAGNTIVTSCNLHNNFGHVGPGAHHKIKRGTNADNNEVGKSPRHLQGDVIVIVSKPLNRTKLRATDSTRDMIDRSISRPFAPPTTVTLTSSNDDWKNTFGSPSVSAFQTFKRALENVQKTQLTEMLVELRYHLNHPNASTAFKLKALKHFKAVVKDMRAGDDVTQPITQKIMGLEAIENQNVANEKNKIVREAFIDLKLPDAKYKDVYDVITSDIYQSNNFAVYKAASAYLHMKNRMELWEPDDEIRTTASLSADKVLDNLQKALLAVTSDGTKQQQIKDNIARKRQLWTGKKPGTYAKPDPDSSSAAGGRLSHVNSTMGSGAGGEGSGSGSKASSSTPHLPKTLSDRENRRVYRHNTDALQSVSATDANIVLNALKAANDGDVIAIGKDNYVIVNKEMMKAANTARNLTSIIHSQINLYLSLKTNHSSRLYLAYNQMLGTSPSKEIQQEMHDRAQIKKLIVTDNLPEHMARELVSESGEAKGFIGCAPESAAKSGGRDIVKVYQHATAPVFKDANELLTTLNALDIKMEIDGKEYFIKGRLDGDTVNFVKCEKQTNDPNTAPYVNTEDVNSYMAKENVKSFSLAVMEEVGKKLSADKVVVKTVDNKIPTASKPVI